MNDASPIPADAMRIERRRRRADGRASGSALYIAVGLGAGAVIALQIDIMRVFSVGSWAHFGSLVVSLAMLGFGLTSAVMTVAKDWFARHWRVAATVALGLFGPLAVAANLYAQQLGFNAIFLVSDPAQKWKLLQMFLAELTPFLAGAVFLGCVFLKSNRTFGRVYFADLAGSGLCGLVFLAAMYVFVPANLIAAPLALWLAACLAWAFGPGGRAALVPYAAGRRARLRRPFRARSGLRPQDARGQRLQGRLLRAEVSGCEEGLRERVAVRLSRGLFELLPAFRAGPLRQRRVQPADHAGQRLSRHVHRQRRPDRRHARPDRQGDGLFPLPADGLPLRHQDGPQDLHHPVRRRHLDRGGAAFRGEGRHGRRGQSGGARGVPAARSSATSPATFCRRCG